jgi:tRNA pseudouridine-54 N-methylase
MSIILDALKKAQQERKQTATKTTYTFRNPGQKPRWVVYGILIVVVVCVLGYLYIPAFHKPKVVAKVIVKPEPPKAKSVTIEAKKVEAKVESIEKKAEPAKTPVKTEMAKPKEEIKVAVQKTEVVKKEVVEKKEVERGVGKI